jgi:hypothetical protein
VEIQFLRGRERLTHGQHLRKLVERGHCNYSIRSILMPLNPLFAQAAQNSINQVCAAEAAFTVARHTLRAP